MALDDAALGLRSSRSKALQSNPGQFSVERTKMLFDDLPQLRRRAGSSNIQSYLMFFGWRRRQRTFNALSTAMSRDRNPDQAFRAFHHGFQMDSFQPSLLNRLFNRIKERSQDESGTQG